MDSCFLLRSLGFKTLDDVINNSENKLNIQSLTNGVMREIYNCFKRQDIAKIIGNLINEQNIDKNFIDKVTKKKYYDELVDDGNFWPYLAQWQNLESNIIPEQLLKTVAIDLP